MTTATLGRRDSGERSSYAKTGGRLLFAVGNPLRRSRRQLWKTSTLQHPAARLIHIDTSERDWTKLSSGDRLSRI